MGKIIVVGVVLIIFKMLGKEFGDYIRDVSPDNFAERTDEEWQ